MLTLPFTSLIAMRAVRPALDRSLLNVSVANNSLTESGCLMPIPSAHAFKAFMKTQVEYALRAPVSKTARLASFKPEAWSVQAAPAISTERKWGEPATARPGTKNHRALDHIASRHPPDLAKSSKV